MSTTSYLAPAPRGSQTLLRSVRALPGPLPVTVSSSASASSLPTNGASLVRLLFAALLLAALWLSATSTHASQEGPSSTESSSEASASGAANSSAVVTVTDVRVEGSSHHREVRFAVSAEPTFGVFRLQRPSRVVIDVSDAKVQALRSPLLIEDGLVGSIAGRQFGSGTKRVARLVVGLEDDVDYETRWDGEEIVLSLRRRGAAPKLTITESSMPITALPVEEKAATHPAPVATTVQTVGTPARSLAQTDLKAPSLEGEPTPAVAEMVPATAKLLGVRRLPGTDPTRLLFVLDGRPEYESLSVEEPPRLVFDLEATERVVRRSRLVVHSAFVKQVRFGKHDSHLRAVLDLAEKDVTHEAVWHPEGLLVTLRREVRADVTEAQAQTPGSEAKLSPAFAAIDPVRPADEVRPTPQPAVSEVVQHDVDDDNMASEPAFEPIRVEDPWAVSVAPEAAGFATLGTALVQRSAVASRGGKRRISVDLKDADIVNVIRLLSEVSGQNIIASDAVKGKVTMRLRNVPWDKALDTILKTKGYDKVREHNILRIAPVEVIQGERESAINRRKAQEQVENTVIKMIPVNYASALDVVEQVKSLLSGRGTVQTDERTNTLIVEDVQSNIGRLVEITKRLDRQTPQVLIEARIVEARSDHLQQLGIQWGGVGQAASLAGNPTGFAFPGDVVVQGAGDDPTNNISTGVTNPARYAVNLPAPIGSGAGGGLGFIFGSADGGQLLNLRLTAMEENGQGRIVSSPRVTTLDNRTARISQGVDIPVSVTSAAGTNTRFIPANLELEVTPHVTNDGSVLLKISTSKNEPNFARTGAAGDPTIEKKQAETEVLVRDGETTVIGGIYKRDTSESYAEVPFLSKIPILGWLFKNRRKQDARNELLIFITPRIVNREEALLHSGV